MLLPDCFKQSASDFAITADDRDFEILPVAAIIRSGMSWTWSRGMVRMISTIALVTVASVKQCSASFNASDRLS
jgi:hypothetical protein